MFPFFSPHNLLIFRIGPPGTGKSHVGVQLMRVLLACEGLGPIVVVYVYARFLPILTVTKVH